MSSELRQIKKELQFVAPFLFVLVHKTLLNQLRLFIQLIKQHLISTMCLSSDCDFLSYYIFFVLLAIEDNALNVSAKNLPKTIIKNP